SKTMPNGWSKPSLKVPRTAPSLASNLVTLSLPTLVTQMLAPSKTAFNGEDPTPKVPTKTPSLALNLETAPLKLLTTQIFSPSKASPLGRRPTGKVWIVSGASDS